MESTQEELEVIQALCDKEGVPQITLSDSDSGAIIAPLPKQSSKLHLKFQKSSGEYQWCHARS